MKKAHSTEIEPEILGPEITVSWVILSLADYFVRFSVSEITKWLAHCRTEKSIKIGTEFNMIVRPIWVDYPTLIILSSINGLYCHKKDKSRFD